MFETIYSAALERQYIQSQQRPAPPIPREPIVGRKPITERPKARTEALRNRVLTFLRRHPGVYFSAADIADGIGQDNRETQKRASYSLHDLCKIGLVQRQYVNHRGHKSNPQRYRAR